MAGCGIFAGIMRDVGCGMRNAGCGMRDAGFLRDAEFMRNLSGIYAGCGMRDAEFLRNPCGILCGYEIVWMRDLREYDIGTSEAKE